MTHLSLCGCIKFLRFTFFSTKDAFVIARNRLQSIKIRLFTPILFPFSLVESAHFWFGSLEEKIQIRWLEGGVKTLMKTEGESEDSLYFTCLYLTPGSQSMGGHFQGWSSDEPWTANLGPCVGTLEIKLETVMTDGEMCVLSEVCVLGNIATSFSVRNMNLEERDKNRHLTEFSFWKMECILN